MLWTFLHLRILLFTSATELVTANDKCRTEWNIQGMALKRSVFIRWSVEVPHLCDAKCGREISCKAITIIENSKYVNWITAPRRQDQIISFQPLNGLMSDDWTAEVSNKNYFNIFSAFATRFNRIHLWSFLDSSSQLKVAKMNKWNK